MKKIHFTGNKILSVNRENTISLWELATGSVIREIREDFTVTSVMSNENILASGGEYGELCLRDLESFDILHKVKAHEKRINCACFYDTYVAKAVRMEK